MSNVNFFTYLSFWLGPNLRCPNPSLRRTRPTPYCWVNKTKAMIRCTSLHWKLLICLCFCRCPQSGLGSVLHHRSRPPEHLRHGRKAEEVPAEHRVGGIRFLAFRWHIHGPSVGCWFVFPAQLWRSENCSLSVSSDCKRAQIRSCLTAVQLDASWRLVCVCSPPPFSLSPPDYPRWSWPNVCWSTWAHPSPLV